VFAGHAVSVAGPGDLDRVLHAIDGLDQIGGSHTMAGAVDALVRGAVLASGATRGAFFQPGERGMRRVASLGEGGSPPSQLLRRAVASAGRVQGNEDDAGLPRTVVWGVPGRAGTVGVLVLEKEGESFGAAAMRSAEAMVRLATPILRERMVSDEVAEEADWSPFPGLVGNSPAMQEVYGLMRKVLTSRVTVLVIGETGTGKELIARAIHMHSDRADGPFVTVDCGALPPTLADSELFGHRKGAFTDAAADREGLVERAEGGTLLLDEVSSMGADLQPKLLRFLQEGEVRRVGETEYRKVDVRVLAASNHDPREDVDAGRLRLDLYHRLSGMEIRVPPLRERKEDIPALASHFLRGFAHEEGKPAKRLNADALERLISHDWPGNVRELENAIRAGGLVAEGETICAGDLPEPLQEAGVARQWPIPRTNHEFRQAKEDAVAEITRQFLKGALVEAAGNVSEAARKTGLQRTYFHRLMKEFGVNAGDFK
jgi:DNA-binding NtrC family response regulator